jgi:hypothetical protein
VWDVLAAVREATVGFELAIYAGFDEAMSFALMSRS